MTTIYGTDLRGVDDLSPEMAESNDERAMLEQLALSITTPRGALWYAPARGYDVEAAINTSTEPEAIEARAVAELLLDERVSDATATLAVTEPDDKSLTGGKTWTLTVEVVTDAGPFEFVLAVSDVTGELLLSEAST